LTVIKIIKAIPGAKPVYTTIHRIWGSLQFKSSASYWEKRYAANGNSGDGSYNELCQFKAKFINLFVKENSIESVIEFGSGDGNQLSYASYPSYIGVDVSHTAIGVCRNLFKDDDSKTFLHTEQYNNETADLAMSLDVIYHLVEDDIFNSYMQRLCNASARYLLIYSSNVDEGKNHKLAHVRQRKFTDWMDEYALSWELLKIVKNEHPFDEETSSGSIADFYVYSRK